jgi:hypothetical protein
MSIGTIAGLLIEHGLLGLLLMMPPAMVLTLGLRKKNRWAFLFGGGTFLALGFTILGITLEGITTGEVFALSRSTLMTTRADGPIFFWIPAAVLFGIAALAIGFGVFLLYRAYFPLHSSVPTDRHVATRLL